MGVFSLLWAGDPLTSGRGPLSDVYYQTQPGVMTQAGVAVDADGARKLSAWYRGRDILATCLAMLPLPVLQRLPNDGGSLPARSHPLYTILHDQPNDLMDSFQWRRLKMYNLIDAGNGYDFIVPGPRGAVDQLQHVPARLVTPELVSSGRKVFHIRDEKTARTTTYSQDRVFHLCGASDDGVTGKGILQFARENLGTALATESYSARIFSNGAMRAGSVTVPGKMDSTAMKDLAQSMKTAMGDWHLPSVLTNGATYAPNTMTPEDAQMILSKKHSVDDIARWLGIPRMMLENSDPSFGNAEQFDDNFLTYSIGQWLSLFEFACNSQLVLVPQKYYVEFTRDAFSRAKFLERWTGHVAAVNAGIKSVDEVRSKEGLNTRGGAADDLRQPQNITGKPTTTAPAQGRPTMPAALTPTEAIALLDALAPAAPVASARARAIVDAAAVALVTKEIEKIQTRAVQMAAGTKEAWAGWVRGFYSKHAALVVEMLQVTPTQARAYCQQHADQVLAEGLAVLETWRAPAVAQQIAEWALAEEAA